MNIHSTTKKGFTLFIAMIVSSLLLGIGFSLGNIILKQLQLTSSGKESQIAFYAADSGAECALFWDRKIADGSSQVEGSFKPAGTLDVFCGSATGGAVASKVQEYNPLFPTQATTTFHVDYTDTGGTAVFACAIVKVIKNGPYTTIDSRGYNAPFDSVAGCDLSNPRTVERGLRVNF